MFEVTPHNLHGVRRAAHHALIMALMGAMYDVRRQQTAAEEPTIDSFNELYEEEVTGTTAPVGLDNEHSPFGRWAGIYYALAAELAKTNNKFVMAMTPTAMWEFLSTTAEHPRVSKDRIKELAEALELPEDAVAKGLHAAAVAEDNKRVGLTDAVIGMVEGFENAGDIQDLYALTNKEKQAMMTKFVEGLDREINRLVSTGLAFRLKDGLGTIRLMKAEIKAAEVELKKMAA